MIGRSVGVGKKLFVTVVQRENAPAALSSDELYPSAATEVLLCLSTAVSPSQGCKKPRGLDKKIAVSWQRNAAECGGTTGVPRLPLSIHHFLHSSQDVVKSRQEEEQG